MKHEEFKILVSAYGDGEVTPEERTLVESHLADCAECADMLAAYRRLGRTIQALPRGEPSRELWLRMREELPTRRRGWTLWRRLLPVASALATLVVAVTLVITLTPILRGPVPGASQPLAMVPGEHRATEASVERALAAPTEEPVPALAPEAYADTPGPPSVGIAQVTMEGCVGQPLALQVVTLSVLSDSALPTPRLRGILYDAEGHPLPGVTLVVTGTAEWQGATTTAPDGSFALELPAQGSYRVALALTGQYADEDQQSKETRSAAEERLPRLPVVLPDGMTCEAPLLMELALIPLGPHDEAILTLRVR